MSDKPEDQTDDDFLRSIVNRAKKKFVEDTREKRPRDPADPFFGKELL